jgi:hypothetical protein
MSLLFKMEKPMRPFVAVLLIALSTANTGFPRSRRNSSRSSSSRSRTGSSSAAKSEHVSGYTRKDGTPVRAYNRRPAGTTQPSTTRPLAGSVSHTRVPRVTAPRETSPTARSSATISRQPSATAMAVAPNRAPRPTANSLSATSRNSNARCATCARDSRGRIARSETAKHDFQKPRPCPATGKTSGPCPGYVIDHVVPLKRGGPDAPSNMQWQTTAEAKAKDRVED